MPTSRCSARRTRRSPRAIARLVDAGFGRPPAALAGRVPEDDADPLWRLRLRLSCCAISCRACAATASPRRAHPPCWSTIPRAVFARPRPPEGNARCPRTVLLAGESWVSCRDPLQGLRPVRLGHLPPRRRAAGRGARRPRTSTCTYMPAHEAATGFPFDHGRAGRLRRGDALRHRLEHAPAAPRRLAAGQARAQPPQADPRLGRQRRRPDDDRRLLLVPGHQRRGPLAPHRRRGGAAGHLPAVRRPGRDARGLFRRAGRPRAPDARRP